MPTYRRLLGLLCFAGLLGLLMACNAAEPHSEALRSDLAVPSSPPEKPLETDPYELPEPLVWERDTAAALQATKVAATPARTGKPSKSELREAMIAQLLPTLETTRSSATFLMTLEVLVLLETPAEKLVPVCLRAVDRLDQFKPMPDRENESHQAMMEGIGECLRMTLEKHFATRKMTPPANNAGAAMTLPTPHYLEHPPQFFVPMQVCPVGREGGAPECRWAAPAVPPRLPEPLPTAPAPARTQSEPTPVHFGVPLQMPVPRATPSVSPRATPVADPMAMPQTSLSPIPTHVPGPTATAPESSSLIPVSTLPATSGSLLEVVPTTHFHPGRLVPVPTPMNRSSEIRPCEPR